MPKPRSLKRHHLRPIDPDFVHQEPPLDLSIQVTAILATGGAIPAYRGPLVEVRQSDEGQRIRLPPRFWIPAQHLLARKFGIGDLAPTVLVREQRQRGTPGSRDVRIVIAQPLVLDIPSARLERLEMTGIPADVQTDEEYPCAFSIAGSDIGGARESLAAVGKAIRNTCPRINLQIPEEPQNVSRRAGRRSRHASRSQFLSGGLLPGLGRWRPLWGLLRLWVFGRRAVP